MKSKTNIFWKVLAGVVIAWAILFGTSRVFQRDMGPKQEVALRLCGETGGGTSYLDIGGEKSDSGSLVSSGDRGVEYRIEHHYDLKRIGGGRWELSAKLRYFKGEETLPSGTWEKQIELVLGKPMEFEVFPGMKLAIFYPPAEGPFLVSREGGG